MDGVSWKNWPIFSSSLFAIYILVPVWFIITSLVFFYLSWNYYFEAFFNLKVIFHFAEKLNDLKYRDIAPLSWASALYVLKVVTFLKGVAGQRYFCCRVLGQGFQTRCVRFRRCNRGVETALRKQLREVIVKHFQTPAFELAIQLLKIGYIPIYMPRGLRLFKPSTDFTVKKTCMLWEVTARFSGVLTFQTVISEVKLCFVHRTCSLVRLSALYPLSTSVPSCRRELVLYEVTKWTVRSS